MKQKINGFLSSQAQVHLLAVSLSAGTRLYEESVICKVACVSVYFQFKRTSCSADRRFPNWASQVAPLTLTKEIPLIINIIILIYSWSFYLIFIY